MSNFTLSLQNAELLDSEYTRWKQNPESVDPAWRAFFEGFELGCIHQQRRNQTAIKDQATPARESREPEKDADFQRSVDLLIYGYRALGHTISRIDPLLKARPHQPLLELEEYGIDDRDIDRVVSSKYYLRGEKMPLRQIISNLKRMYCSTIGTQFMHIQDRHVRSWLRERIEGRSTDETVLVGQKIKILRTLMEAESFEHFLHTKYVGQKRFSLEGGESLMVILDTILQRCPQNTVKEIVMGMAHRGRLTVLANFLGKKLNMIFSEFSENYVPNLVGGDGDVKYHLGYIADRITDSGETVHISLAANPSHLEAVDPVVQGKARARQRLLKDTDRRKQVLPVLIHGDAAFAGQGIVAEVFNMSQLPGYRTGGTVHIIVNNQIGFTTMPSDARSTMYATDVAKMIDAPIFHVNGDDPLAVALVTEMAFDFRQEFGQDVVIDLYCYRRHGHNEGDEPNFTQPALYREINKHPSPANIYKQHLIDSSALSQADAEALDDEYQHALEQALNQVRELEKSEQLQEKTDFTDSTAIFQPPYSHEPVQTAISPETLEKLARALTTTPTTFNVQPKIERILLERRARAYEQGGPYDWAYAEALAFGSLMLAGTSVRLSGQDSRRGTFSQRHAVLYDAVTPDESYIPLKHIDPDQASFCVYNSLLSEAAVLGFDYGYSMDYPSMLCIWEAQFGDFANGAQVIIDQFIAPAESKWQRPSGIVMLLPHGYEGQGPEHSSARVERFLQLCAEENIQVCIPTTPAQYFHLLRRQMMRTFRKPLIIMTPKSLLRSELCVSSSADFTSGSFREILDSPHPEGEEIKRVIFCTGKVYYDLLHYRTSNEIRNTGIVRVEQLYPLNDVQLLQVAADYPAMDRVIWCQEEPQNMGAWSHIGLTLSSLLNHEIHYAGRPASPAAAGGSLAMHKRRQKRLVEEAFTL